MCMMVLLCVYGGVAVCEGCGRECECMYDGIAVYVSVYMCVMVLLCVYGGVAVCMCCV